MVFFVLLCDVVSRFLFGFVVFLFFSYVLFFYRFCNLFVYGLYCLDFFIWMWDFRSRVWVGWGYFIYFVFFNSVRFFSESWSVRRSYSSFICWMDEGIEYLGCIRYFNKCYSLFVFLRRIFFFEYYFWDWIFCICRFKGRLNSFELKNKECVI